MENNPAATVANFTVADFTVHGSRNLITRAGEETAITPKMLAVLTELAKHQGQTLSKEQLLLAVWGTLHTSDMVLSRAISDLRKVFGDSARQQAYIETVSKKGYRLKPAVNWQQEALDTHQGVIAEQASALAPAAELPLVPETTSGRVKVKPLIPVVSLLLFTVLLLGLWWGLPKETMSESSDKGQAAAAKPSVQYLTRDNNFERNLRFSVDGKMLAYAVSPPGQSGASIQLHSLADNKIVTLGSSIGKINTGYAYDVAPAFSPDGQEIAYLHFTRSGCLIRVYNLLDGSERELAPCPYAQTQALDWSPDGKQLVTTVFNQIKKIEGLALIDSQSGNTQILPLPQHSASGYLWPRFSPGGQSIAVVYYQPNSHLWTLGLVDKDSGAFTEILSTGEEVSQVLWDETGEALYYLLVNTSDAGIWKVALGSKATTQISKVQSSSLDFDEVSGRFAYIHRDRKMNIWHSFEDDQGKRHVQPVFDKLPQTSYPSLSADNKLLAFVSTTRDIDSLWLRSLDDNYNRLVFQAGEKEKLLEPAWSPDGKYLLISVLSQDASRMIQFDLELGDAVDFVSDNNVKMGKWSQDGSMFYWYEQINGTWQVIAKDLQSGTRQSILSHPVSRFSISDNKHLHYQKIGTVKVHSRQLAGDSEQAPMDKMLLSLNGGYEWHAHNGVIYYVSPAKEQTAGKNNQTMLYKMVLATGLSEPLYDIEPAMMIDSGRHLSVSGDGRSAFFTKVDKYHTDVVVMSR